jgi:hypothetical protein
LIKIICPFPEDLRHLPKKAMEKKWITTEQMLEILKSEPDSEQQYSHHLGGILRSTRWLEYSIDKNLYGESANWFDYTWYTEAEFLEIHADEWWMREH